MSTRPRKLKKEIQDSQLENKVLKELLKKTYQVWNNDDKSPQTL
jgi:hypothetical protein